MSVEAMRWAWRAADLGLMPSGCGGQMAVLLVLADHANNQDDEEWLSFPSVAKIARRTCLSEKSVERHLQWLIAEGWISRATRGVRKLGKGKFVYQLERDRDGRSPDSLSGEAGRASADNLSGEDAISPDSVSGEEAARSPDSLSGEAHDVHPTACPALPDNLSGFTRQFVLSPTPPNKDEPPRNHQGTPTPRASEEGLFEAVFQAFAASAPTAVSRPRDRKAWDRLVASAAVEPALLPAAAARYLDLVLGRGDQPFSLARWLSDAKWEPFLAPAGAASDAPKRWPGPPEIRAALAEATRETFAASYLDPCRWDAAARAIVAPGETSAKQLKRADAWSALAGAGVEAVRIAPRETA